VPYQLPVAQTGWTLDGTAQTSFTWECEDQRAKLLALTTRARNGDGTRSSGSIGRSSFQPENPQEIDDRLIPIVESSIWNRLTNDEKIHVRHPQQA